MKTSGTTDLPLSSAQKCICNIVMGVMLVAIGVILSLAGGGVMPVSAGRIAAPTVLLGLGAALLFSSVVARNALTMWITGVLLGCGCAALFRAAVPCDYGVLFPIFIASPGIGCAFAACFAEEKLPQIRWAAFFGIVAGLFSLKASGACGWGLTAGLVAAFFGVCVIATAALAFIKKDK